MASTSSGGISNRQKRKIWDESPNTFTEFGALSSEMRPSGGFFSRLWKRNKDDPSQSGLSAASYLNDDPVVDNSTNSQSDSDISGSVTSGSRGATPPPSIVPIPRLVSHASISSDVDTGSGISISVTSNKNDQLEEVVETQVSASRVPHRTLSSVLNRLGSILDHRSATPQTYKDSDFKQYWMPDSSCRECYDCGDKFTTFRRRHHCRICGQIFCSKCCNQELPGKIIGYKGGIRVCTYCCRVVQKYAQQSSSTGDYRALEDLRAISQLYNDSGSFEFGRRSISPRLSLGMEDLTSQLRGDPLPDIPGVIPSDMNTPFDLTPQSEFSSQDSLLLESKLLIQDSVQLRELWRQVFDMEAGVEIQTMRIRLRTHQNCIVGKELVDWLIKRDKAATRDQALAIGQALLYAGYLDSVGHQSLMFKDDFALYRPGETALALDNLGEPETMPTIKEEMEKNEPLWFQEIGRTGDDDDDDEVDGHRLTHSTPSDDPNSTMMDSEGQKSNSSESDSKTLFYANQASRSGSFSEVPKTMTLMSRDVLDEPLPRQDSSVHGLGDDFLKGALFLRNPPVPSCDEVTCPHGWRSVDKLREENGEKLAYERLKRAHTGLWHAMTRQMLSEQSVLLNWEMVIYTCITQISQFVRPDVRLEGDDMDIRNYVHIKKVSGGNKSDTSLFHGVVFTKNIAHKKMKTKIANPLILLLRGTIEFQRVENKFSSLEPQILQEREFMRNCVMKMVAYRPNVVVVEKSVSRLAQEYLLEAGITLLYNVKLSVMERLARFTQADIVPSIDGLVSKPNMGFCHDFRLQTFTLANKESKTLAVFDGCATHLGCTIVLRGGSSSELRRVKYILKFMAYTAYNSLLELCFCMDEFAMPQPGADELEQPFEGLESSTEQSLIDGFSDTKLESSTYNENRQEEEEEDTSISGGAEYPLDGDADPELDLMDYQHQAKSCMTSFIDKDVDTLSMDYRGGEKSTRSSELSSLSEFADNEGNEYLLRRERSFSTQSQSTAVRRGRWFDSTGTSSLDRNSEQGDGMARRKSSESVLNSTDVKDVGESKVKSHFDQNRLEIALPRENHFYEDDDAAGIYAVTTASIIPIPLEMISTLTEMTATSMAIESPFLYELRSGLAHREKIRHMSGVSVVDTMSGRSTPDYVFKYDETEKIGWDGSPKLIGNIMCIIPKSSLPIIAGGPPQMDTENGSESENSVSKHVGVPAAVSEPQGKDINETCIIEDSHLISSDTKALDVDSETHMSDAPPAEDIQLSTSIKPPGEDNLMANNAVSTLKKTERSGSISNQSRPSTSILTELTDFSDPLLGYQNTQDESIFNSTNTQKIALKEIKQTNYKRFRKALDGVHLSVSPYHKYSVPFIETDKGSRCSVRKYLPDEIFWSRLFDGEESQWQTKSKGVDSEVSAKATNKNSIQILDAHSLITCKLTEPVWDRHTQTLLADFRARGGRIQLAQGNGKQPPQADAVSKKSDEPQSIDYASSGLLWEKKIDCLDPTNHQKLMVLFSSYSYKSANHPYPCVYPWVVTMEFYGRNDITLGGFLERFCFRKQYSCPSPTCDTPMADHVRRFVHGNACINVLLKTLDNEVPGGKENILMWSWCRKCKQVTPVVPISGDTWSLSFAKYLDLRFHSSSFLRRGSAEPCPHSLHHDHFQYFGHRNIVASFKLANICLKEVALPATSVSLQPPTFDAVNLVETVRNITYKATDRYSLMLENTMKLKQELTNEAHIRAISEILLEQQNDKTNFRDSATNIQMKINELIHSVTNVASSGQTDCDMTFHLYAIFDNIELLRRKICEDVSNWNTRMQEFMLLQQKKHKNTQVSTKKDKETGPPPVEELEKSWKAGSDRSSKASIPPSPVVSLSSSGHFQLPPPPSPVLGATATSTKVSSSSTLTQTTIVINATSTEESSNLSGAANGNIALNDSSLSNSATTAVSPPVADGTTIPELRITETSSTSLTSLASSGTQISKDLTTPAGEGIEDAMDGWFQDLKGATRRWLSTSTFTPLPLPFDQCEHHALQMCENVPVAVYDHEPSSIIAYALSSSEYICGLREIQTATRTNSVELNTGSSQPGRPTSKPDPVSIITTTTETFVETGRKAGGGVLSFLRGGGSSDPSPQHNPHFAHHKVEAAVRYVPGSEWGDSGILQDDVHMSVLTDDATPSPDEKPKVGSAAPSPHIELQFSDSAAKFYCRVYFADQFRKLRKLIFPGSDNIFIRSLSRCKAWEAKGGKSGSSFSKTVDDRFILKQMSSMEVESFEKFGPQYFQYIKLCRSEQQPTALAKIMGVYRIGFRNTQTNHALRQDVLVMENLFYNRKISQKFDLKGSMRNRLVNTTSKRAEDELVLLDENLLKCSVENPLYLRPHSKHVLKSAITSDSAFLSTNLVMDYSLLVGVDEDTQELVVGIIDYIRTFTWDKRLEMVFKSSGILGGQGKMPTVVSPQLYRGRFLEAMDRYFLHVPDHWMGLGKDFPSRQYKVDISDELESNK